jgi:predicted DNA-binding transcriptional regulator YafY
MPKTISFTYLNHNGKKAERTVDVETVEFLKNPGFGYQSGWFVSGFDHEKKARRSFSLGRIILDENAVPDLYVLIAL